MRGEYAYCNKNNQQSANKQKQTDEFIELSKYQVEIIFPNVMDPQDIERFCLEWQTNEAMLIFHCKNSLTNLYRLKDFQQHYDKYNKETYYECFHVTKYLHLLKCWINHFGRQLSKIARQKSIFEPLKLKLMKQQNNSIEKYGLKMKTMDKIQYLSAKKINTFISKECLKKFDDNSAIEKLMNLQCSKQVRYYKNVQEIQNSLQLKIPNPKSKQQLIKFYDQWNNKIQQLNEQMQEKWTQVQIKQFVLNGFWRMQFLNLSDQKYQQAFCFYAGACRKFNKIEYQKKERQKKLWQDEQRKKSWWNYIGTFIENSKKHTKIKTINMQVIHKEYDNVKSCKNQIEQDK